MASWGTNGQLGLGTARDPVRDRGGDARRAPGQTAPLAVTGCTARTAGHGKAKASR